jgi:uncharacterized protein (DUF3084 family)
MGVVISDGADRLGVDARQLDDGRRSSVRVNDAGPVADSRQWFVSVFVDRGSPVSAVLVSRGSR